MATETQLERQLSFNMIFFIRIGILNASLSRVTVSISLPFSIKSLCLVSTYVSYLTKNFEFEVCNLPPCTSHQQSWSFFVHDYVNEKKNSFAVTLSEKKRRRTGMSLQRKLFAWIFTKLFIICYLFPHELNTLNSFDKLPLSWLLWFCVIKLRKLPSHLFMYMKWKLTLTKKKNLLY